MGLRGNTEESLLTKDDLHLGARKGLSDAPVWTEAKAQSVLRVRAAVHVEDVRIREDFLIAVARGIGRDDTLACFDDLHCLSLEVSSWGRRGRGIIMPTLPPRTMSSLATLFIAMEEPV